MLMHVASDQLIVSLIILVLVVCATSSSNDYASLSAKVRSVPESMLKEKSISTSIVREERKKRRVALLVKRSNMSDNETLLDSTRLARPTQKVSVKTSEKKTIFGLSEPSVNYNETDTSASVTTEESTLYGVKWMKWQKYLADQQLFLPIHIPHIDENLLLRLLKDSESAKRKTATGPTPVHNECTEPSLFISLAFLILIGATTILCQRMRSIDFVRSPSIKYTRTVNNDAKFQLTKAKASLPNIAGMKGTYGRGKLSEIADVFDHLVRPSHPLLDDTSFATEIPAKDQQLHMRIKLLTAEELAREEI